MVSTDLGQQARLLDDLPWPAFALDAHGCRLNAAWRALVDCSADCGDDDRWLAHVFLLERPEIERRWREGCERKASWNVETALQKKDGTAARVMLQVAPTATGWLGIATELGGFTPTAADAAGAARSVSILDRMTEGLVLATLDGVVISWNKPGLEMHGFSSLTEALRSLESFTTIFAMTTPDGTPVPLSAWPMMRLLRGESVQGLELELVRLDGSWRRRFIYNGGTTTTPGGTPVVFITITDLTEHIVALQALRDSDARLRTATAAAGIGTWSVDYVTKRRWFSVEMARMLGFSSEQERPLGLFENIHPDDIELAEREIAAIQPDGPNTRVFGLRMMRTDGSPLWVRSSAHVVFGGPGGRTPQAIIGACVDITEIRQAERRLATQNAVSSVLAEAATLSEATPKIIRAVCESEGWDFGGIWEVDPTHKILRCAEMWHAPDAPLQEVASLTRTLSFRRGEALVGRVWDTGQAILLEEIENDLDTRRAVVARKAGLTSALAFPIVVAGEVIAVVDFLARSITHADGRLLEMFAVIGRQLSFFFERKRSECELRTLEIQLRQAQRIEAIGQLSGGIAHDFNNILAAIVGNAQLAMMDVPADHPAVESLEQIAQASARAKTLVQQILTFAKQRPQQRQVIAAGPILEESTRLLRAIIPATVELQATIAPDVPDIFADATQIEQVVVNLGTNAWHALDGSPGKVQIALRSVTVDEAHCRLVNGLRPGRWAMLSVTDTGRGMPAEVQERIFEPFFTTRHQGKGTGLGLSVVHGIVQTHAGVVRVTSAPGTGTTFDVYFPDAGAVARTEVTVTTPLLRGTGQHILFVDDEAPLVALNKRLLQHLGYRVTACTAPSAALSMFIDDPWSFSAVMTDMNMPEISGVQLATEVLRVRPDVPVLLASGFITDELQTEAVRLGVAEVLHKPLSIAQLSEALARVLTTPDLPDLA